MRNGMVCSSHPLASVAGMDLLKAGGNAVDAAIAANAMLSLVEPMMCGPGGDLFAILWIEKEKRLFGLNASGRSPFSWDLNAASELGLKKIPTCSPLAWSVPGCASGWHALAERFGELGPKEHLKAAVGYAREGFAVSPVTSRAWQTDIAGFPDLAKTYYPDGQAPAPGQIFRNPDLADLYSLLAEGGYQTFYGGEITDRIVRYSEKVGGRLSRRDFEEHTCNWVEPVHTTYRGYEVWEIPPNTQGIATLQMLNILENFDIGAMKAGSPEHLHHFVEAKKLAYEDRAVYYADPERAEVPVEWLISKRYGKERAKKIDGSRAATLVAAGVPEVHSDTTYLTTADSEGNMVSLIQSIYQGFGSKYVPDGLGFALQNRGLSFSLDPNHRNKLEPHKRPFHTIIPAFVTKEGEPVFSFGVMGGDFQPQGQVQVLMNILDFGMSVQQAGDQSRIAHRGSSAPEGGGMVAGGVVDMESGFPTGTKEALVGMGHVVSKGLGVNGGYQGIWSESDPRRYFGASESRFDGCAIGY